jgi:hypothetical protein
MHAYWRLTDYVFKQIENSTCMVSTQLPEL